MGYNCCMARKKWHTIPFYEQIRKSPGTFVVYILLRLSVILILIAQVFNRDWKNVFLCGLTLILFTVPSFIEKNWHIDIPETLEIIILLFIYAAEILGEIRAYYVNVPGWDTALHTITGFLSAAVGFSLVDILNRNEHIKLSLSPLYVAMTAFCFSLSVGIIWEFFEFSMDMLFGLDMQKDTIIHSISSVTLDETMSNKIITIKGITETTVNGIPLGIDGYLDIGLIDTMKDLIVTFIGAAVFSPIGYVYLKKRGDARFAKRFIPSLHNEEEADKKEQNPSNPH